MTKTKPKRKAPADTVYTLEYFQEQGRLGGLRRLEVTSAKRRKEIATIASRAAQKARRAKQWIKDKM